MGRLYRDAEMPVLVSIGVGPRRMLRPLAWMALPVVAGVGLCSLWLGPWADRVSERMIEEAGRNLLIAGMEPGRFTELPGGGGVIYVGAMSDDSREMQRVFVYRQKAQRFDVTTSQTGTLSVESERDRYAANEIRLPEDLTPRRKKTDLSLQPTTELFGDPRPEASAQLHSRLAPPLLTLAFALLAIPLSRSSPRQARYGNLAVGFLIYLFSMFLMLLGTQWLEDDKVPGILGLWWMVVPLLVVAVWLYARDGAVRRPKAVHPNGSRLRGGA
jgi:lipopolysaccharide export system permease protein